jgi:hypothetical protein
LGAAADLQLLSHELLIKGDGMSGNQFGRDQRDYIQFRDSGTRERGFRSSAATNGSFTNKETTGRGSLGRLEGRNRFGEENIRHDSYQDDQYRNDYDPTYQDEYGMKHPYEHGGRENRWSDDLRSEGSRREVSHFGKGPKGYQRSDIRIRDEACEILTHNWELDASDIEVEVEDRCIILKGEVASRRDKRLAEDLVEDVFGIDDVRNQLKIRKHVDGWVKGIGQVNASEAGGADGKR